MKSLRLTFGANKRNFKGACSQIAPAGTAEPAPNDGADTGEWKIEACHNRFSARCLIDTFSTPSPDSGVVGGAGSAFHQVLWLSQLNDKFSQNIKVW
jgi:hypothetical protein